MKKLLFMGAIGVLATGCPGDTCDTGDTACKGGDNGGGNNGGGAAPLLMFVDGSCSGSTCTWSAQSDGTIGLVELELAETGDPTSTCGPGKSLNAECGFWEESHDAFGYTGASTYGGDTFAIDLALVTDYTQQVNNDSTLFDLNSGTVSSQLTVMFTIYDDTGAYADCAVYGHDPSWFSADCTNNWN